jgi:FkbM family methyltransferase
MTDDALPSPQSHTECDEDLILFSALGHIRKGFYIDVGAMDPDEHSVTKLFYERGWNGINIEPRSNDFAKLVERRPRDINLQCAVASKSEPMTFFEFDEHRGHSTSVREIALGWEAKGQSFVSIEVQCRTLREICETHAQQRDIHFLKIDVEGAERDVIESADFHNFRPWVLAIESTLPGTYIDAHEEWEHLILSAGYRFAVFHGINRYYVASERDLRLTAPPEASCSAARQVSVCFDLPHC